MELHYWTYENKIIFKPKFNNKLDNYIDIISKYNELIFSNYNDCSITIKTNNYFYYKYEQNFKYSIFNQKIIIQKNVTHLTFSDNFNQQVTIPYSVAHLTIGYYFHQQVNLPNSVEEIEFGCCFNLEVQNLPNSIKKVLIVIVNMIKN